MGEKTELVTILSIDAWWYGDCWQWNQWYDVGKISKDKFEELDTNRKILKYMREHGYLSEGSKGKVAIEDDEYNLVIVAKGTREPLYAIEYGRLY